MKKIWKRPNTFTGEPIFFISDPSLAEKKKQNSGDGERHTRTMQQGALLVWQHVEAVREHQCTTPLMKEHMELDSTSQMKNKFV